MAKTETSKSFVWRTILSQPDYQNELVRRGYFEISSKELNAFSRPLDGPDARILVKFDSRRQIPRSLDEAGLFPITISKATFAVGDFQVFSELPPVEEGDLRVIRFESPHDALNTQTVTSESVALLLALSSGLLTEYVGNELELSFFGKVVMGAFDFSVRRGSGDSVEFSASNTQIEIDAIFENATEMLVMEAKIGRPSDFNIRQLYFPFRHYQNRTKKTIRPILMIYSKGVFEFIEYRFTDIYDMSSFEIIGTRVFAVLAPDSNLQRLREIALAPAHFSPSESTTFPQANDFYKVIELVKFSKRKTVTSEQIRRHLGVVERQVNYYIQAAAYLGLVEKTTDGVRATALARDLLSAKARERDFELASLLVQIPTIGKCFLFAIENGRLPSIEEAAVELADQKDLMGINDTTKRRRLSTAISWTKWILSRVGGFA